jgi:hypothetical protein
VAHVAEGKGQMHWTSLQQSFAERGSENDRNHTHLRTSREWQFRADARGRLKSGPERLSSSWRGA